MKTTISKSFEAEQSIDHVWKNISDPSTLVSCLPGATLTEALDDKNYKGEVRIKFGPIKAKYNGQVTFEELDHNAKTMKMVGKGVDAKGKGSANMVMDCKLSKNDNKTLVDYTIDISLTGVLAQFGSRLITDVSHSIFDEFTNNFKEGLKGEEVDNTLNSSTITKTLWGSFVAWVKRLFGFNT